MTELYILPFMDPALKKPCVPVTDFESAVFKKVVEDLRDTAVKNNAHGLAANQIGYDLRVFVAMVEEGQYKVFVNPKLVLDGDKVRNYEGCLSFPTGMVLLVERPEECTVTAQDENGVEFTLYADDVNAVAIQHEADHLDGIRMIDRVSRLEQKLFLKKIEKLNKKYVRNIMKHIKVQGNNTKITIR